MRKDNFFEKRQFIIYRQFNTQSINKYIYIYIYIQLKNAGVGLENGFMCPDYF